MRVGAEHSICFVHLFWWTFRGPPEDFKPVSSDNAEKTVLKGQERWGARIYRSFYDKD